MEREDALSRTRRRRGGGGDVNFPFAHKKIDAEGNKSRFDYVVKIAKSEERMQTEWMPQQKREPREIRKFNTIQS